MVITRRVNVPAVSGLALVMLLAAIYVVTDLGQIQALGETYPGAPQEASAATVPAAASTAPPAPKASEASVVPAAPAPPAEATAAAADPAMGTMVWAPPPTSPYAPLARPTISLKVFRQQLADRNSPMLGEAEGIYRSLFEGGSDPAIFLGFVEHESSYGQQIPAAHNPFGMMCHLQQYDCVMVGRYWQSYPTWAAAAADWNDLMHYYRDKYTLVDLAAVLNKYAPPVENKTPDYIIAVKTLADTLRAKPQA